MYFISIFLMTNQHKLVEQVFFLKIKNKFLTKYLMCRRQLQVFTVYSSLLTS